ncbi:outer membrane protein assembly factor BamB family protein [Micromonospora antibiotica]|uniref:PQQ-binding-like beta-propeller repeat protein n=1 Tax=Micromonospora antibiotica TaxID=2807623 RepID=A0ABS3VHN8_9ACTN|nr:PQQ-binding-like beta-propeller repeat protein [Micromonospora antibiotica]MBO4165045.1 PQQ-binding-like beta-propeller repeat protein [Micromonospora antibiotica]
MSPSYHPARRRSAVVALSLVVGLVGCAAPRAERAQPPPVRVEETQESLRDGSASPAPAGPRPAWSAPVRRLDQELAEVGQFIVVPDERELRAVDRATGQDRWRHPFTTGYRYVVVGGSIVAGDNDDGGVEVLDAATGVTRWRAAETQDVVVDDRAVYARECAGTGRSATCAIIGRDVQTGRRLWKLPSDRFARVSDVTLGARTPYAPAAGRYVAVRLSTSDRPATYTPVAPTTGRTGAGRLPNRAWYGFVAGDLLVSTDNDPPKGDQRCTVSITSVQAASGGRGWSGVVYSGRRENGECAKRLVHDRSGQTLIGSGTRLVAVTADERPQLVDLRTGATVWKGAVAGVPIDGDDRSVLVRDKADTGGLALLDLDTGASRWTAPDPALPGTSASWRSAVTGGLVAVSGAEDGRPQVLVYDVGTGRELGRYPGWLAGAGRDWVAVSHSGTGGLAVDLHTF